MHIAATYGNFDAIQVLVARRANLWALDNRGYHPAKVAAANRKYESCRFLDNTAIHWQTQLPDQVRSLQDKALKDLEKRLKEAQKPTGHKGKKYPYATMPVKRTTSDPNLVRSKPGKKLSQADAARQNFVLQSPSEATDHPQNAGFFPHTVSGKSPMRPLLRGHSGAILNSLNDLAIKQPIRKEDMDLDSVNSDPMHKRQSGTSSTGSHKAVITMVPLSTQNEPEFLTENDSALATFLHSLDLLEAIEILHREKMDMDALMLCKEQDLQGIGLALGPRKKILSALERRKEVLAQPGQMKDSEV